MFTIDFLKKQGLPAKNRSFEVGVFAGVCSVAVIVVLFLCIHYFHNATVLRSKQNTLARCESMLEKSSGEGSAKHHIETSLDIYNECYDEIGKSLGRYVQWTPVLREFVELLPESMLLNELRVIRTIKKKKVASAVDPKKKVDIEIIHRSLKSDVYDFMPEGQGTSVENYLDDLRKSESLAGVFDKAYIVESSDDEYEDSNGKVHMVKNHIISCLLKSQAVADAQ